MTEKQVNYTDEMVATLHAGYDGEASDDERRAQIKALAQEVMGLMENRLKAVSLGKEALKTIEREYSLERVHQRYLEIYYSLCGQSAGQEGA